MNLPHPALYEDKKTGILAKLFNYFWKSMLASIIPVRIMIFLVLMLISSFIDKLLNIGTNPHKPLPKWRLYIWIAQKRFFYRLALFISGYIIITRGKLRKDTQLIIMNHQALVDIGISLFAGCYSSVAKGSLEKNLIFGPSLKVTRSILARKNTGYKQIQERIGQIPPYPRLGIYPTGTTTYQKHITRFRTGVFATQAKIQICGIQYNTNRHIFYTAGSAFQCILASLSCPLCFVELIYDDEVLEKQETETAQEFADRAGKRLAKIIGGVYLPYTYKDVLWFGGEDSLKDQLSEEYVKDQLWRGNWIQWCKRCKKLRLDPQVSHSREFIEGLEAKKKVKHD